MFFYSVQATHKPTHLTHRLEGTLCPEATAPSMTVFTGYIVMITTLVTNIEDAIVFTRQC